MGFVFELTPEQITTLDRLLTRVEEHDCLQVRSGQWYFYPEEADLVAAVRHAVAGIHKET